MLRPAGQGLVARNEARATREGEVGPGPVDQDGKPIAEADEEEDVDGDPYEPSGETTHVCLEGPLDIADSGHAANGCHIAFVEVAEGRTRFAGEVGGDEFGDVIAHLHGGLGDAGYLMAILLEVSEVAENEDIQQAGGVELVVDDDAAAFVELDIGLLGEHLAEGRGQNAGSPQSDGGVDALAVSLNPPRADAGDLRFGVDFDTQMLECGFGLGGEILRIGGEHARAGVEQENATLGGIDVSKIMAHVELSDVADGAGQFDASGTTADDYEVERRVPALLKHLALGELEGQQHAAANLDRVFNGFEAGRERFPFVVAEVGVGGAGGQDEIVVVEACAAGERDLARGGVDGDDFIHEDLRVVLAAQDGADGLGDVGRREHRQRDLVEQRLEGVVIAAIDYGDVDWQVREPLGGVKAGKAGADDDHTRAVSLR